MPKFDVKWTVTEKVNGPGTHDDGVRDGDVYVVAHGAVEKEAESAQAIARELRTLMEQTWPAHALGPTYDLDRVYEINITPVGKP